jgi:hypothetical protein
MSPLSGGYEVFVDGKPVAVQNGLARIINAPQQFNVDLRVPSGGATAPISGGVQRRKPRCCWW